MLTQLATIKTRLAIPTEDTQYDTLLTNAIQAVSARFDKETNRTLARTESATHEFDPGDTEIIVPCYPIETVTKFELKSTESTGWQEITPTPDYLIRRPCIISLLSPLRIPQSALRITYAGGYVLPGDNLQPSTSNFQLPADLENAAIEQVAYWFQTRDNIGLDTIWPHFGTYQKFAQLPLLLPVQQVLTHHRRWTL
jgi:hypothetical protein